MAQEYRQVLETPRRSFYSIMRCAIPTFLAGGSIRFPRLIVATLCAVLAVSTTSHAITPRICGTGILLNLMEQHLKLEDQIANDLGPGGKGFTYFSIDPQLAVYWANELSALLPHQTSRGFIKRATEGDPVDIKVEAQEFKTSNLLTGDVLLSESSSLLSEFFMTAGAWQQGLLNRALNHTGRNENVFLDTAEVRKFVPGSVDKEYDSAQLNPDQNVELTHTDSGYFRCVWYLRGSGMFFKPAEKAPEVQAHEYSVVCFSGVARQFRFSDIRPLPHRSSTQNGFTVAGDKKGRVLGIFNYEYAKPKL